MGRWVVLTILAAILPWNAALAQNTAPPPFARAVAEISGPVRPVAPVSPPPRAITLNLRQEAPSDETSGRSFWRTPWPYLIIGAAVAVGIAAAAGAYGSSDDEAY